MWKDALDQAAAMRSGEISCTDLTSATLERIDRLNPAVAAYVALDRPGALAAARRVDEVLADRPEVVPTFLGVSLSIKDVEDVAGMPTTHSCQALVDNVAAEDGPLVRRFRRAGFIVIGKTNVPEFCTTMTDSRLNGTCRNPWDLQRTPGGSSGGAAAALSADLCAVAHGTDGAGSVRVPAAFCGVLGLKPTRSLVSFGPHEGDPYFKTSEPGVLGHSVRDLASVLGAIVQPDSPGTTWAPPPSRPYPDVLLEPGPRLRVAVSTRPPMGECDEECASAALMTGRILDELGHRVEESTPEWRTMLAAAAGPMNVPGAPGLLRPDQYDLVEPRNRPMVTRLSALTILDHARWIDQVREATRRFCQFWERFDVLVTPTCGIVAPPTSWAPWDQTPEEHMATFSSFPSFAQPFNLSGQPALSLPLATSATGLPIGIQIAGRHLQEATLLQIAAELETALPWSGRRPKLAR